MADREDDRPMDNQLSTGLIHADDAIEELSDVSPAIHLSSTYSYSDQNQYRDAVYSRLSVPTVARCEAVLAQILGAPSATYCTGLSAIFGLLVYLNPRRIYIERAERGGYHGTLGVAEIITRLSHTEIFKLSDLDTHELGERDVIWLETPLNPTGEATDIAKYSKVAKAAGAILCVDATFAPPPLQDPFKQGADWVMHSATKYFGGHSDLLAGVVASHDAAGIDALLRDRQCLGTILSGHTAWLLLRSLRTFKMRVERQAATALELVKRLDDLARGGTTSLSRVAHSSLQTDEFIKTQMKGHSATFAIYFTDESHAAAFPGLLALFQHATSLGGVESLAEWRAMSDAKCDRRLVRLSIGIEDVDDLYADIINALKRS